MYPRLPSLFEKSIYNRIFKVILIKTLIYELIVSVSHMAGIKGLLYGVCKHIALLLVAFKSRDRSCVIDLGRDIFIYLDLP